MFKSRTQNIIPILVFSILGFSALHIAIFSLYPMAFDEEFHLGLIRIYSTSWLPYGIEHTRDMAAFGMAAADPSYLWHFMLSFPYRLMEWFGLDEQAIVIVLRLINISVFMLGMWLYYTALRFAGFGKKFSSVVLIFFALIPVVPMLAGQINYDNPLFVVVALGILLALRIQKSLATKRQLPSLEIWLLVIVLLIGMSIKYAFLPIAAGIVSWLLFVLWKERSHFKLQTLVEKFWKHTLLLRSSTKLFIFAGLVLASFFAAKYIVNYSQYGDPIPDCAVVFDDQACKSYGPWARNTLYKQELSPNFESKSFPLYIAEDWIPDMAYRLTFVVAGPTNDYQTKNPLIAVIGIFVALTAIGLLLVLYFRRTIFNRPVMGMTLFVSAIYFGSLMIKLYGSYKITGQPVAINGRYLLPLLPFVGAGLMLGYAQLLEKFGKQRWLARFLFISLTALVLSGAGVLSYILLAEPTWYW